MEHRSEIEVKQKHSSKNHNSSHTSYLRFFAMIGLSMAIMYILTYMNSYQILDHAWFSETRLFMTLMMGGAMMAIMLFFMLGMYKNSRINAAIFVGAIVLIGLSIWLVRSQVTVTGVDYMEAMIPHHSIAILTSERSGIVDTRVRELADGIIDAQRREIKEMEWLIQDINANGLAKTEEEASARPVPNFTAGNRIGVRLVSCRKHLRFGLRQTCDLATTFYGPPIHPVCPGPPCKKLYTSYPLNSLCGTP